MAGRINRIVASLILDGLRDAVPEALDDEVALRAVTQADDDEGVPLEPFRHLLAMALAHDGGRALLLAGQYLRRLSHPLLFVLLNSDSPRLMLDKEARLAAFLHSRHRVVIEELGPCSLELQHVSEQAKAPDPAESLAACGQHLVLLEEIGCEGLRCRFPESAEPERWVYADGTYGTPAAGGGYRRWALQWSRHVPTRKPMPGLDEVLLSSAALAELDEQRGPVAGVERVVRRDLGRTWKLAEVATALSTSPRSLQRALGAAGAQYSDVVDRVRNEEAARLLRETELSVTEVGYVCGFADSAHFSRSFKKRLGRPPSEYRRAHAP